MRMRFLTALAVLAVSPAFGQSMIPPPSPPGIEVPDWALPQSPTHKQIAPPLDFHRDPVTFNKRVGQFENSTDVGAPLAPSTASYDAAIKTYTLNAAGYNIWYQRDEFQFLWNKMSGDVSLAASVEWPDKDAFHDRKVALMIRDSLDDDSRTITAAQHGNGMTHIAWRADKTTNMTGRSHRTSRQPIPGSGERGEQAIHPTRFGIEKKGDQFQLWISWQGEPIHPEGAPITFKTSGPFYVGVGFTSHLPANLLTANVKDVVMENAAGKIR